MALLDDVKVACRVTTSAFDNELTDLIKAAFGDMGITDIDPEHLSEIAISPLIKRAVLTYCRLNFGTIEDGQYDRLKSSYDEQKSQLMMSSDYRRDWDA